jgi:hypothetical protein
MNTNTSMLANETWICDPHGPQANTYEQRHVVFMCLHRWQRYVRNKGHQKADDCKQKSDNVLYIYSTFVTNMGDVK